MFRKAGLFIYTTNQTSFNKNKAAFIRHDLFLSEIGLTKKIKTTYSSYGLTHGTIQKCGEANEFA